MFYFSKSVRILYTGMPLYEIYPCFSYWEQENDRGDGLTVPCTFVVKGPKKVCEMESC